jgi:hypothetical protein
VKHVLVADRPAVLRTVTERIDRCDAHLLLAFCDEALSVTDLDEDGIGEITFAYARACGAQSAPATLKLLMLENGDKYVVRGTTDDEQGRGVTADPSFDDRAPAFLEHARETWHRVRTSLPSRS